MEAIDWFALANQTTIPPPRRRSRYGVNRKFILFGEYSQHASTPITISMDQTAIAEQRSEQHGSLFTR